MDTVNTVEVKLLNYNFRFRPMLWREEFSVAFDPKDDRLRMVLSRALVEVSGLKITSQPDAKRIMDAIPSAVVYRIFLIYKGSLPPSNLFKTVGLYKAPEPSKFVRRIEEAENEREHIMDRVEQEMEARFGKQELIDARKAEMEMLRNSKGRGLTKASGEDVLGAVVPPPNPSATIKPSAKIDIEDKK